MGKEEVLLVCVHRCFRLTVVIQIGSYGPRQSGEKVLMPPHLKANKTRKF